MNPRRTERYIPFPWVQWVSRVMLGPYGAERRSDDRLTEEEWQDLERDAWAQVYRMSPGLL